MKGSLRDLRDDEILRFLRFEVTESAAATYTQKTIDTQLSIDRSIIWMIHSVDVFGINSMNLEDSAQNASESMNLQITRESKSSIIEYDDADLVERFQYAVKRYATIGTDTGPVCIPAVDPLKCVFPIPIAYAAQNIHVGIQTSHATPQVIRGRIGYTLRKVSDKFFYRVASALIG